MDVQWDNRGLFALQGPKAKDVMQRLIGNQLDLATVGFGQCFTANVADVPVFFSRCGYTGEDVSLKGVFIYIYITMSRFFNLSSFPQKYVNL